MLRPEGQVKTITGISSAAMPKVHVPLKRTSTARTYAVVSAATDKVAGFLQSFAESAGETINVATDDGQTLIGIAADTSFAIGDRLKLDATDPTRLTKLTPSASGAPTGYAESVGIALEVPAAAGNYFLFESKKERIAV